MCDVAEGESMNIDNWLRWQLYWDGVRQRLRTLLVDPRVGLGLRGWLGQFAGVEDVRAFFPRVSGHPSVRVGTQVNRGWYVLMEGPAGRVAFLWPALPLRGEEPVFGGRPPAFALAGDARTLHRMRAEYGTSQVKRLAEVVNGVADALAAGVTWIDMPPELRRWAVLFQDSEEGARRLGATWLGELSPTEAVRAVTQGEQVGVPPADVEAPTPPTGDLLPPAPADLEPSTPPTGESPPAGLGSPAAAISGARELWPWFLLGLAGVALVWWWRR